MTTTPKMVYLVKVIGQGIIFRSLSKQAANDRCQGCVKEAEAKVISVPPAR